MLSTWCGLSYAGELPVDTKWVPVDLDGKPAGERLLVLVEGDYQPTGLRLIKSNAKEESYVVLYTIQNRQFLGKCQSDGTTCKTLATMIAFGDRVKMEFDFTELRVED